MKIALNYVGNCWCNFTLSCKPLKFVKAYDCIAFGWCANAALYYLLPPLSLVNIPHCLVATDIPNFHTQRLILTVNLSIPEFLRFFSVFNYIAKLVNLNFTVGVPLSTGGGTIGAEEFNQFKAVLTDFNRFIGPFGT